MQHKVWTGPVVSSGLAGSAGLCFGASPLMWPDKATKFLECSEVNSWTMYVFGMCEFFLYRLCF